MPLFEVRRGQGTGFGGGATPGALMNTMGHLVVMNWYQQLILDGRGYQVRAGTITTPLVGDVVITDTAAEFCVDVASGTTLIPVFQNISVRLGTGTLHEYATKSVATVSSAGTAFTLLPLKSNGTAATATARVQAAGAVTVTAELATATLRHWSHSNPVVAGAGNSPVPYNWEPGVTGAPVLVGARCLYTQVAATGTGPSYYANLDVIEVPTLMVDPS
mgnify:CR=1 FL=1